MIRLATWILTGIAFLLSPIYAVWVFGGWLCDRRERRRATPLTHCFR